MSTREINIPEELKKPRTYNTPIGKIELIPVNAELIIEDFKKRLKVVFKEVESEKTHELWYVSELCQEYEKLNHDEWLNFVHQLICK